MEVPCMNKKHFLKCIFSSIILPGTSFGNLHIVQCHLYVLAIIKMFFELFGWLKLDIVDVK